MATLVQTGKDLRDSRLKLKLSQAKLAEITQVPQHIISAFELGKIPLPSQYQNQIVGVLSSKEKIDTVVKRNKRYQEHVYEKVQRLPERVRRASKTIENPTYVAQLAALYRSHCAPKTKSLTALSLFSRCVGFSLGVSAAGFKVTGFVELEDDLRAIYRQNFPDSLEIGSDISKISDAEIGAAFENLGEVDLIVGGPPCQGFSLSGKRDVSDPRNTLFRDYLRFVDVFRPKIAILENVRLLTSMKNSAGGLVKDDIVREFGDHGYQVVFFNIDAANYGVPQHRDRVIFVAIRRDLGISPSIPVPTHGEGHLLSELDPLRTFGDATSDLEYLESGERSQQDHLHEAVSHPSHVIQWLWDVPEGRSAHDNEDPRLRPPSGYNTTYKRQVWKEPGSTVQTTFGMISGCRNVHPIATRSLTIREAARIQSFPDQYVFNGSLGTIRTGIGNAVPPLLAFHLGQHAAKLLDD